MSAITETEKPGIEFGQIQGTGTTDHQLGLELEHADQIPAFGDELLEFPYSTDEVARDVVVFSSMDTKKTVDYDHEQLDLRMDSGENVLHDSLWINFQIAHHRKRSFLSNSRISRRRSR